jgi:hypothetical protein
MVHRAVKSISQDEHTEVETQGETQMENSLDTQVETQMETQPETLVDDIRDSESVNDSQTSFAYTYMFSVCIFDDTASCDAIVFGKEGERMLGGVTAEQLYHNPSLQQDCQDKLHKAIAAGLKFEFEIVTYLTVNHCHFSGGLTNGVGNVNNECNTDQGNASTPNKLTHEDHNEAEEQDPDRYAQFLSH